MRDQIEISKGVDWVMVWLYIILVTIGILCIYSVEFREGETFIQGFNGLKKNYSKQVLFAGIAGVIAIFILLTDSKFFTATANISYVLGILLILATFVLGREINGSKSWIPMGFFNLQPVETSKIFTALALAKFLSRPETNFEKPKAQLIAGAIALAPAVLSILQNETGLALVYFSFLIPMYREGLPDVYLIVGLSVGVLIIATVLVEKNTLAIILTVIAALIAFFLRKNIKRDKGVLVLIVLLWGVSVGIQRFAVPYIFTKVLHPYQVERIMSTFGVEYDPAAANLSAEEKKELESEKAKKKPVENYNVKQSKIAIGSGGLWGKGFLKGTQTQGDFVPEQHTDFIFTSVGENFGFLGSTTVVLLYVLLITRIVFVAERQRSKFSRVYAYSVAAILFFHVTINIGMTIGLAPVIGITLPLMSYGGSSLLTFTILLFILVRLDADRQMILR